MSNIDDPITLSSDSEEEVRPPQATETVSVPYSAVNKEIPEPPISKAFAVKSCSEKHVKERNGVEKRVTRSQNDDAMKRVSRTLKGLQVAEKFMGAFDPENSNRERRKLSRFDKKQLKPELDICDCLIENCVGCFFPCSSCKSLKCGVTCRNGRQNFINSIESDATHTERYHPLFAKQE